MSWRGGALRDSPPPASACPPFSRAREELPSAIEKMGVIYWPVGIYCLKEDGLQFHCRYSIFQRCNKPARIS